MNKPVLNQKYHRFVLSTKYATQKVQNIYGNITGFITSIFASLFFIISVLICLINGPFSPYTHWVSNMGARSSLSCSIFNGGFQITAFFLIIFTFATIIEIWRVSPHIRNLCLILPIGIGGLFTIIGIFLFTTWDMFLNPSLHALGAFFYFFGAMTVMGFFTLAFNFTHQVSLVQNWITIINTGFFLLSFPVGLLSISLGVYPGIPLTQLPPEAWQRLMSNMDPALGWCRILEWIIGISFYIWIFQTAHHLNFLKSKHQAKE